VKMSCRKMNSEGQGLHKKADLMKDCLAFFMVAAGGDFLPYSTIRQLSKCMTICFGYHTVFRAVKCKD
jgi:hypothetical protein